MKKEVDKRLIIPKDAFEEEASEGLGRLNRDEAAEDLRDLEGRMAARMGAYGEKAETRQSDPDGRRTKRLRKHLRIWIPAAAAVVIILVASTVYIGLFRERMPEETAMVVESKKDTVLIAMAPPITKAEAEIEVEVKDQAKLKGETEDVRYVTAVVAEEDVVADEAMAKTKTEVEAEELLRNDLIIEILEPKEFAEEVIVQSVPERSKAAQGIPATRAETRAESKKATETETRAAKDVTVADRQAEDKFAGPDHGPRPAGGMEAMSYWISSNIRYPQDVLPRTDHQVIVSFKVRADSTVYDLKAEQSPGEMFTEEAFRLLREGPKWEPAVRNGTPVDETVRVRLLFK